ncbi:HlyD family type I secretion periplasmic adaptor subunit [Pseudorhodoplanes sp.]|uniref:HlyD family type I secretion periplasmic adaptor subunit n=1 Tax=Pseudorhodoplanes sp. TaxID=1934341 RepID=UPI00391AC41A
MSNASTDEKMWYAGVPRSARIYTLFGTIVLAGTVLGFGVWGGTAPIAGAVVASGVFVVTGQNKIVQHLEGGVIREIAVQEGDRVQAQQVLITLDDTAPKAELRRLELRLTRLQAMAARLLAEMKEETNLEFPESILRAAQDPDIQPILESQKLTFEARRQSLNSEIATIEEGINALQERVEGAKLQMAGVREQLRLLAEEIEAKAHLVKSGFIRKPELLALQRAEANLQGELGRLQGELGDARERISRGREQIAAARKAAVKTAVEQLHDVRAELSDVRERIRTAQGVLDRIQIVAPVKGIVVKLRYHTPGGVIEAGKNIMEILPLQTEVIIEVRIRPQDIDHVKPGQHAMVRLTALNQRLTPMIGGRVVYVSADAVPDEKKGVQQAQSDIYLARIALNPQDAALIPDFTPTPGMPAEVYITTSERTFFEYLTRPIRDSMARAFREN